MDESSFSRLECQTYKIDDSENMQQTLFEHLCPLLIIKMLPLRVFNDLDSTIIYGQLFNPGIVHGIHSSLLLPCDIKAQTELYVVPNVFVGFCEVFDLVSSCIDAARVF